VDNATDNAFQKGRYQGRVTALIQDIMDDANSGATHTNEDTNTAEPSFFL